MFKIRLTPNTHRPCPQGPAWISLLPVQMPVLTNSVPALTYTGCRIRIWQAEPSFPGSHSLFQLTRSRPSKEFLKNSWVHLQSRNALPGSFTFYQHTVPFQSHILTLEISFTVSWSLIITRLLSRQRHFPVVLSMLQVHTCHSSFKAGLSTGMLKKGTWHNKSNR